MLNGHLTVQRWHGVYMLYAICVAFKAKTRLLSVQEHPALQAGPTSVARGS